MRRITLLTLLALGCAEGKTPPPPTQMVTIDGEALTFTFGSDEHCDQPEGEPVSFTPPDAYCPTEQSTVYPTIELTIPAFQIDEHEVTNLQFQHCVARGECTEPRAVNAIGGGRYDKYYDEDSEEFANHPVVFVTYTQAEEYCRFVGKRLPTEFEWAAAAQRDEGPYPWEEEGCPAEAGIQAAIRGCNTDLGFPQAVTSMESDQVGSGAAVVYDLAGNVQEWTSTIYDEDVTCAGSITGDQCLGTDPENPEVAPDCFAVCEANWRPVCQQYTSTVENLDELDLPASGDRVVRGGSYNSDNLCEARLSARTSYPQTDSDAGSTGYIGFRCAKDL